MENPSHDFRALLISLRDRGCSIRMDNNTRRLHINPRRLVSAQEAELIHDNRDKLVALIQGSPPPNGDSPHVDVPNPSQDVLGGAVINLAVVADQLASLQLAVAAVQDRNATAVAALDSLSTKSVNVVDAIESVAAELDTASDYQHYLAIPGTALDPIRAALNSLGEHTAALADALRLPTDIVKDLHETLADTSTPTNRNKE